MKIRDIDTLLINSPGRKWTIVRVHTDEGLMGLGEATYSNKEPVVVAAIEHMKQELIGEDPARIEYLWHKIWRISSLSGLWRMAGPVWMSALSQAQTPRGVGGAAQPGGWATGAGAALAVMAVLGMETVMLLVAMAVPAVAVVTVAVALVAVVVRQSASGVSVRRA